MSANIPEDQSKKELADKQRRKLTDDLFTAIRNNLPDEVAKLIDNGADVNSTNWQSYTPIIYAINHNKMDCLKVLIEKGANLEIKYNDQTPLLYAVSIGDANSIKLLLENKTNRANINAKFEGNTALVKALQIADLNVAFNMAKILINQGADVNTVSNEGNSPLHLARKDKTGEMTKFLIEKGANIYIPNLRGYSALEMAIINRQNEILQPLKIAQKNTPLNPFNEFQQQRNDIVDTGHIMGLGRGGSFGTGKNPSSMQIVHPFGQQINIPLEGNYSHLTFDTLYNDFENYVNDNTIQRTKEEAEWDNEFLETIKTARSFSQLAENQESIHINIHNKDKFILLPVDFETKRYGEQGAHAISVCLYGNYLVYFDRGGGKRFEQRVYQLTDEERSKIENDWAKELFRTEAYPKEDEVIKFFEERSIRFKEKNHSFEVVHKGQKHGNCSYANRKGVYEVFLFLKKMQNLSGTKDLANIPKERLEQYKSQASIYARKRYKLRTERMRDNYTDKLLSQLSETRKLGAENSHYHLCLKRISAILYEHHGQVRGDNRQNKISGESRRALKMLKALTEDEQLIVLRDFNGETLTSLLRASRGINNELYDLIFNRIKEIAKTYSEKEELKSLFDLLTNHVFEANENIVMDFVEHAFKVNYDMNSDEMIKLLMSSIINNHQAVVKKLLTKMNVDLTHKHETPLMHAAYHGKTEMIKLLLEEGADIDSQDDYNTTALMMAAMKDHEDAVKVLLDRGASFTIRARNNETALQTAIRSNNVKAAKILLKNAIVKNESWYLSLAIKSVLQEGQLEMTKIFIDLLENAKENAPNGFIAEILQNFVTDKLIQAVSNEDLELLKFLVTKGASFETKNEHEKTLLIIAARNKNPEIVEFLIKNGVNLDAKDISGNTAVMTAALNGNLKTVQHLIERGANFETTNVHQETPLILAAKKGHPEIVEYLIKKGANIESKDSSDNTAFLWALEKNNLKVIDVLIKNGAPVNTARDDGFTPLIIAAQEGNPITEILLDRGADIDATATIMDDDGNPVKGNTALILAAEAGHENIVKLLIKRGAKMEAADENGNTALTLATQNRHQNIVEFLKNFQKQKESVEAARTSGMEAATLEKLSTTLPQFKSSEQAQTNTEPTQTATSKQDPTKPQL